NASGGSSSSSSLLIRSKNPRRCQAENPLKLLSEFAGPALPPDGERREGVARASSGLKIYRCI
ncbi:hypothetical protein, partial [Bradyrhizobium liaoningense]|uniref:hypothetical protein n=1 Tax=Bradyrhizobium liaoningense TaxID=43992 RepID=UPI0024E0E558